MDRARALPPLSLSSVPLTVPNTLRGNSTQEEAFAGSSMRRQRERRETRVGRIAMNKIVFLPLRDAFLWAISIHAHGVLADRGGEVSRNFQPGGGE